MIEQPNSVEESHLTYLDNLRESGATNMYGAGAYLQKAFDELNRVEVHEILAYWMDSFEERHNGCLLYTSPSPRDS